MNKLHTWSELGASEIDITNRTSELLRAGLLTPNDLVEYEPVWIFQPYQFVSSTEANGDHDTLFISLDKWYRDYMNKYIPQCINRDRKSLSEFEHERFEQGDPVVETYRPVVLVKDKQSGFPILVFASNGGDKLYLSPFRGYCFQFSGTINGGGDYGSNEVVGLNNILNANYRTRHFKKGYQSNIGPDWTGRYMLQALIEAAAYKVTS